MYRSAMLSPYWCNQKRVTDNIGENWSSQKKFKHSGQYQKKYTFCPRCHHVGIHNFSPGGTAPIKRLDTPTHSRVFLYFYCFLHCRIIVETSKLWNNTFNHVVIKVLFEILLSSHLCLDDSFAHSWHSRNELHEVVSHLECFSSSLEGVPTYTEHLLAPFPSLCGQTHPNPSQLGGGQVIVEARSSDAGLHHTPSWSNIPYTAWSCVLGHFPIEKQMIVTLSPNQMGWRIAAECCGSHAG